MKGYIEYSEVKSDIDYLEELEDCRSSLCETNVKANNKDMKSLPKEWLGIMEQKFGSVQKGNNIHKFIKKYHLDFMEFVCLIIIIQKSECFRCRDSDDTFKKYNVRFETSNLKKHNLVYDVTDPLQPFNTKYKASFRAITALSAYRKIN